MNFKMNKKYIVTIMRVIYSSIKIMVKMKKKNTGGQFMRKNLCRIESVFFFFSFFFLDGIEARLFHIIITIYTGSTLY